MKQRSSSCSKRRRRRPKPLSSFVAKKRTSLTRSVAMNVLIVVAIAQSEVEAVEAFGAIGEAHAVVTDAHHRMLPMPPCKVHRPLTAVVAEGALHLPAASETSIFQKVKVAVAGVATDVVIDLVIVAVLPHLGDLAHPGARARPFDVDVVLHPRASQGARLDAAAVHHHLTLLDPHRAVLAVRLLGLQCAAIELGAAIGHFHPATTAEGCAGLTLDLRLQRTNQALRRSGYRVPRPGAHRAVDVGSSLGRPIHGLLPHNLSAQRRAGVDVHHLLKTLKYGLM